MLFLFLRRARLGFGAPWSAMAVLVKRRCW